MNTPKKDLDALFPLPTNPLSALAPARLPGPTNESARALLKALKDNHQRWHIFFNDRGFHNHASHHLLAIYALGATNVTIEAAYKTHVSYQRPAFESPGPIDDDNWKDHLGDERYYASYLSFFSSLLLSQGGSAILEDYVFSHNANIAPGDDSDEPPQMLNRFLAGLLHPMIHTGYGAEFGMLGMFAEGLAQTCLHGADAPVLVPPSLFQWPSLISSATDAVVSRLASLSMAGNKSSDVHALTVLSRIINDPDFSPKSIGLPVPEDEKETAFKRVLRVRGEALFKIASTWNVPATREDVEKKFEEIAWMNTLIFGVGGWSGRKQSEDEKHDMNADFFLLHLVTSSLLLPSLLSCLSASSASLLLRTYFSTSLAWYISRGRPALPIADFYAKTNPLPIPPGQRPSPAQNTLPTAAGKGSESYISNAWLPILQDTLVHPNEHLCKLQRSLAHLAAMLGPAPAGCFSNLAQSGEQERLEGVEKVDGTLFLRIAGLTMSRLAWMREGETEKTWDRKGFFEAEA